MPAVSQHEYLRRSTGQDTAEEQAEQMTGHLDPGPAAPEPPAAPLARPFAARRYGVSRHTHHAMAPARPDRSQEGHQARQPSAGHDQGVPAFPAPLPGTHGYRAHEAATGHAPLDVGPADPYYTGGMAHGVPVPPVHGGRPAPAEAEQLAATARHAAAEEAGKPVDPVPVYIVAGKGAGARPMTRAAMGHKNVPAPGGDPFRLVTRDPHRRQVRLLNESTNAVRITFDPVAQPAVAPGYGALLPASMSNYLTIETEDEIWAYTEPGSSGTAQVSWISEYDIPKGG